ncbi:MAG: retention module-containing protein, partial [Thioalkalivibrio sp.]|uniref:retention module-containing protein n=1 Tax=Thioalkalivibrio sp. TaxID=2093813 RepID=UPI0039765FF1
MSEVVVATVESIVGTVIARDEDGNTRVLQPGDQIFHGEEVIAEDGAFIEMAFEDGSTMTLAGNESATITPDLAESAEPEPQDAEVADATVEEIIAALDRGEDITDLIEAPAAGLDGGGGEGSDFVRIARNSEEVGQVTYAYDSNPLGGSEAIEGETLATADADAELDAVAAELTVTGTVDDTVLDISGTSTDVGEGETVDLKITDQNDNTVTAQATVAADGTYSVDNVDVSGLTDGELIIDAEATDNNGNGLTAQTTAALDAVDGDLTVDARANDSDAVLDINGTSEDVADGDTVNLTITDQNGDTVTTSTTVDSNGDYGVIGLDVSELADGDLTIDAAATDNNGNGLTAQTTATLDAVAGDLTVDATANDSDAVLD